MSVLIKGMKMPTCDVCRFQTGVYCGLLIENDYCGDYQKKGERNPYCPLIEVPPHGRLIDANVLYKTLKDMDVQGETFTTAVEFAKLVVNDAPTVIEAEGQEDE